MQKQLTHRLVVPDGGDLRAEHDGGEEREEETFPVIFKRRDVPEK